MPLTPVVTPPSDGYHDLSSDLGEGENARAIFDISEFSHNPNNRNSPLWNDPERRQWVLDVARQVRQRDRQREIWRRRRGFLTQNLLQDPQVQRMYDMISERMYNDRSGDEPNLSTSSSEGEPHIFGRQGTIGINGLNLPPPPPVPQDPINYP